MHHYDFAADRNLSQSLTFERLPASTKLISGMRMSKQCTPDTLDDHILRVRKLDTYKMMLLVDSRGEDNALSSCRVYTIQPSEPSFHCTRL